MPERFQFDPEHQLRDYIFVGQEGITKSETRPEVPEGWEDNLNYQRIKPQAATFLWQAAANPTPTQLTPNNHNSHVIQSTLSLLFYLPKNHGPHYQPPLTSIDSVVCNTHGSDHSHSRESFP